MGIVGGAGMHARTAWDKFAPSTGGSAVDVPLDDVLPGRGSLPLRPFHPETALWADPWAATAWAFPAQRYLESGRAQFGARVAADDPHVTELGAYGVLALPHPPAPLVAAARDRRHRQRPPRRVRLHLQDPVPTHLDPADAVLCALADAGPDAFADAVIEFAGAGVEVLNLSLRRRLLASAGHAGARSALGPLDELAAESWRGLPKARVPDAETVALHRGDPDAAHDELLIVNAPLLDAWMLRGGAPAPVRDRAGQPVERVAIGGCVGGDLAALRTAVAAFEERPPARGVEAYLVPASSRILTAAKKGGLADRAATVGAHVTAPRQLPDSLDLSTTACLHPTVTVVGLATAVASAQRGRLVPPEAPL
jgi:homoaconitase/3-isopropylmalate dehydratase large subunit